MANMHQRQKSLFSFFHQHASYPSSSPLHTSQDDKSNTTAALRHGGDVVSRFETLKRKLLRPPSEKISNTVSSRTNDADVFNEAPLFDADNSRGCCETTEEETFGPFYALDTSIPGIKRIRKDGNFMDESRLLKRKKLMEAIGEGEEQKGLWEEAKAKFYWLCPSKIRDSKGRKPGDPSYDKRTLQIPQDVLSKMSASQKQYWATKCHYMDTILFFKVGKFYELYEIDAEVGHKELNWKMTVSGVGKCRQVGVPESGIEDAVSKLLARGYKVGRMEQIETAEQAKAKRGPGAMVQRELLQVLSPSTLMDENMKPEAIHLLALYEVLSARRNSSDGDSNTRKTVFGFAFVDAAAGRFYVGSIHDDSARSALGSLLTQVAPQELLYESGGLAEETLKALRRYSAQGLQPLELTQLQPDVEYLEPSAAIKMIKSRQYFCGSEDDDNALHRNWCRLLETVNYCEAVATALGALVMHLVRLKMDETLLKNGCLASYEVYKGSLRLDGQTLSNLEIFHNNSDGGKAGTLFAFLDNCSTPFGKRLLRRWMCHPLQSITRITERLDAVEEFRKHPELVGMLRSGLHKLPDLERLVSMIRSFTNSSDRASIPLLSTRIQKRKSQAFSQVVKGLVCAISLLKSIRKGHDEGPVSSKLLLAVSDLEELREANESLVSMASFAEKQFLNAKNQLTKKDHVLSEKDLQLLDDLFLEFNQHHRSWLAVNENLSQIDVLLSFVVTINGANGPMCRPSFVPISTSFKGARLEVNDLWHPLASGTNGGAIVRNNITLGGESNPSRAMLLTGPNMGGKSTLLRATCVAVILAQMGCYVPAASCVLSPVDIIFTRLGATDRMMSGESTFMVECSEASSVLRYASPNSLVILDELGRGTSTFDGYAIAYAVFRHLVDAIDCRLLFATHYHPLTKEFAAHPSVCLYHMAFTFVNGSHGDISDSKQRLCFLYKLRPGASPDSYGLHAATLAGLPESIIKQAEKARSIIQSRVSAAYKYSEHRMQFSHVHEGWMKAILAASEVTGWKCDKEDAYDTLLCVWHEVQASRRRAS